MSIHYIGMAGLRGCMPSDCDVYESYEAAVESLCQLHDLGKYSRFRKELKRDGFVLLRLHEERVPHHITSVDTGLILEGHGNEYAQVMECTCSEPWIHSGSMTKEEWQAEYGENS